MAVAEPNGFIVLHRKLLSWEWYKNTNTKVLFLHLLLTANFAPASFEGVTIQRGELVTSYASLSAETGLSVKEIRTALNHLNRTGETASRKMPKFSIITVKNYDKYQAGAEIWASEGQSKGKGGASEGQQYNKNNKNNKNNKYTRTHARGRKNKNSFDTPASYDIEEYDKHSIFD